LLDIEKWAKAMIEQEALVLDIESTGGSFQDEMIELSVVDLKSMNILYESLFKPTRILNYYAQKVHNITDLMLKNAPYLETEYNKINSILNNRTCISYNISFDKRVFHQSYDKYELDLPNLDWQCLMKKCQAKFGKQLKLSDVCAIFEINSGTHRASSDALAAANVIQVFAGNK